ncbi:protein argonaute 12-like isoform X1 [Rhodamnia argentea]|uniref:Protein argonaute 12-like isoform X1 n=1 Tax=Rhodamnia argentea TaxID=178133 RepID=A0ABM3H8Y2_9MYRT|nr:protein argonaute 12-like isoform X1 [Rhodamnia argentea]
MGKSQWENLALQINVKVVASMDWPEVTKYRARLSTQPRGEIIKDLCTPTGGMIGELIRDFASSTGNEPRRIIFYRDGVSEGQFSEGLDREMTAIRQVICWGIDYHPPVTLIVVQKRNHTLLFPNKYSMFD